VEQKADVVAERDTVRVPTYLVESVDRAMQVIELLRAVPTRSLTELAGHLGVAPSTVHRLLSTMAHRQVVQQDPDTKAWSLGPALVQVGLAVVARLDVRRIARPELEALSRALEETVHLARLDGDHVLFLDTVESTRAVRVTDRTGVRLPAHSTASGKVLLAQLDRSELRELLPERLTAVTPRTRTSRASLERELATIRRRGFAVDVAESERGLTAMAAVVSVDSGAKPMSVTVSIPSEHVTERQMQDVGRRVVAAAGRIGMVLDR
jgi:IclR family acetate operon transcriptional repressor